MSTRYIPIDPPERMRLLAPLHTMRPSPERLRWANGWYRGGQPGTWVRRSEDGRIMRFTVATGALELVGFLVEL